MSTRALTAKYRPQTFAQVAGQETVKAILSRASLEGKVAPAYLLSGTRGVGKTTLARIFAKALNCRTAPTAEPCNQCDMCRAITLGTGMDVVEIDGASNRGIDDVRRLKEVVGYAPMEGRYKIFIIDEAHMLSREAFNALLKTLEEPPARVTFIMATTEAHKFPATIISRCQHFVFKRLPEQELINHLQSVLTQEGIPFEESAVRLIARRGAGSVRDAMSLLGQVLALETGSLTEAATRSVLGLAGQEAFTQMVTAFRTGDSLTLSTMLRQMLDQGLDMGFFLRELVSLWRNLFMLRQSGAAALPVVNLPENEARQLLELAEDFSLSHIHACWQMTLEGQRRVLTSLEPALALELLLLNLAMLPHLLSLENLSALGRRSGPSTPPGTPSGAPSGGGRGGALPTTSGPGGATPPSPAGMRRFSPEEENPPHSAAPEPAQQPAPHFESPSTPHSAPVAPPAPQAAPLQAPVTRNTAAEDCSQRGATEDRSQGGATDAPMTCSVEASVRPSSTPGQSALPAAQQAGAAPARAEAPSPRSLAAIQPEPAGPLPWEDAPQPAPTAQPAPPALETAAQISAAPAGAEKARNSTASANAALTASPALAAEAAGPYQPQGAAPASPPPQADTPEKALPEEAPFDADALEALLESDEDAEDMAFAPVVGVPMEAAAPRPSWDEILGFIAAGDPPPWFLPLARRVQAEWQGDKLIIQPADTFLGHRLHEATTRSVLEQALVALCGDLPIMEVRIPQVARKDRDTLREELQEQPAVRMFMQAFDAQIIDFGQIRT